MIRVWTIEELAEDAFLKAEYVKNLLMANTPIDYEARKKAFVELAIARAAANEAEQRLLTVSYGPKLSRSCHRSIFSRMPDGGGVAHLPILTEDH